MKSKPPDPLKNLGEILWQAAQRHGSERAIVDGTRSYNFSQVAAATAVECERIKDFQSVPKKPVALLIPNCPAFSIGYFAALWAGAIVVPLNPLLSDQELESILQDCQATLLIVESNLIDRAQAVQRSCCKLQVLEIQSDPIPQTRKISPIAEMTSASLEANLDETAVILYTSGSTGNPKGVELTHRNLLTNAESVSREKFSTEQVTNILGPGHVALAALPLSHAFGQTNLQNGIWFGGGAICYLEKFEPLTALNKIVENKVTFFAGVPTMYVELLKSRSAFKQKLSSLKFCVCGGAALNADLKKDFLTAFEISIQESYGLTETSPMISCQAIDRTQKIGCVGKPIAGVKVRIVEENSADEIKSDQKSVSENDSLQKGSGWGELQVQGPNVFRGYLNQPAETEAVLRDGWFSTGDIAYLDDDGEIWIVDRKKEVINRGGYCVYPREVETLIQQLDWVEEVAVVGVRSERLGEEIKAFVVPRGGFLVGCDQPETLAQASDSVEVLASKVIEYCKMEIAAYKCPRIVEIMKRLPKGSTGKPDKKTLREIRENFEWDA